MFPVDHHRPLQEKETGLLHYASSLEAVWWRAQDLARGSLRCETSPYLIRVFFHRSALLLIYISPGLAFSNALSIFPVV